MASPFPQITIGELEEGGAILGIQDGNHGERHPTGLDYVDEGIPFIMASDLSDGRVDTENCHFISEETARSLRIGFSIEGDVLLTHKGTLGNVAMVNTADPFIILTPQVTYYRTDNQILLNRYLIYAFRDPSFQSRLRTSSDQGTRPFIGIRAQRQLTIVYPGIGTQRRIANILSAYDDLIEINRRRMALLEKSARLLFQEWFVRLRFPSHEHTPVTNGMPEGWERRTLGDCLTLKRGHDLPEANRVPGTIPIVSSSGITGFHNVKKANGPGLVTGRYGTLGEVYYVNEDFWPHNTALYVCDLKGSNARVLYFFLKHAVQNAQSNNAAVPGLNRNVLHTLRVLWPPEKLRNHFDCFLEPLFRQLAALRQFNEKLTTARDLLLPRLMSGEVVV